MKAALVELVKCTPFGGFALICIAFMSWHYHKQLKAANEMYLKSIEEVKKHIIMHTNGITKSS